jgi:hypothetical protein
MATPEASGLIDIIARILELRRNHDRISPSWVATEAWQQLDPRRSIQRRHPLVYIGCHLQLRQLARELLRKTFEGEELAGERSQHELFPILQARYPSARSKDWEQPEYIRLDVLTEADADYNVERLRAEGRAKLKHADALEAWKRGRFKAA